MHLRDWEIVSLEFSSDWKTMADFGMTECRNQARLLRFDWPQIRFSIGLAHSNCVLSAFAKGDCLKTQHVSRRRVCDRGCHF